MRIAAFDAGKKGAVAYLDTDDCSLQIEDVVLDSDRELDTAYHFSQLLEWEPDVVAVEDCFRPKSLVRFVGEVIAIGKILQAEVRVVAVSSWKTRMTGQNSKDKKLSVDQCLKRTNLTIADLTRPRAKVPSDDRAEAVLLALYLAEISTPKRNGSKR